MKKFFYILFSILFNIFKMCPLKSDKITFIATHDTSSHGNIGMIYNQIKAKKLPYRTYFIKREDYKFNRSEGFSSLMKHFVRFFIIKNFHLATSGYVILDNVFLPAAYFRYKREAKVIQLWHSAGAFKKFGMDIPANGELRKLEERADSTYTHLIVNSESIKPIFAKAFNMKHNRVYPSGLPRTDIFFNEKEIASRKKFFYRAFPELKDKKIILYAPTFRDDETTNVKLKFDFEKFFKQFGREYVVLLRLHPFVKKNFILENHWHGLLYDFSDYEEINDLLLISDMLITDYSSIIFEYSILKKPIIFYAYDLEKYENQLRGFYYPYKDFVPGSVVSDMDQLIRVIAEHDYNMDKLESFVKKYNDYFDGSSTERFIEMFL
ncbi:CDP-glycerol glycerophosphotransferase family protein [Clostridium oryzae]|nr:CDP-glycerol glycerophosphotransferase family protein [Clostridium oryzae]